MKGRVYRRGGTWSYRFDIDPDPLTGRRRQASKGGFRTEREAWQACRTAMQDYEHGRYVRQFRRTVEEALTDWLERIRHSLKPSMAKHWQNYIAYYVVPHIGRRMVQDVDGSVCDALYAKLLAEGRIKAKPTTNPRPAPVHVRRFSSSGLALPCRPYRYDEVRCYRVHAADDPLLGKPITARLRPPGEADPARHRPRPGLEPKTLVGHPAPDVPGTCTPRPVLRLVVLEATSGMRRSELAGARIGDFDFEAGALTLERTRVVVDGQVVESDGKTENAQRIVVLDLLTVRLLRSAQPPHHLPVGIGPVPAGDAVDPRPPLIRLCDREHGHCKGLHVCVRVLCAVAGRCRYARWLTRKARRMAGIPEVLFVCTHNAGWS
jgi:integrase